MKFGYKRGPVDHRDHKFAFSGDPAGVPQEFSLRQYVTIVFDQGDLGSCTGNAISGALKTWMVMNNYKWPFTPSRLQIYYGERLIEGTVDQDAGADIRDGFKVINATGTCPEDEHSQWNWPYDISKYTVAPNADCMKDAGLHKCLKYASVNQDQLSVQQALVNGTPLVIGISVFNQIQSPECAKTGVITKPGFFDQPIGGHALQVVGYDKDYVHGVNSWGTGWGDLLDPAKPEGSKGVFYLPWNYLLDSNLCSDIWSVGLIT